MEGITAICFIGGNGWASQEDDFWPGVGETHSWHMSESHINSSAHVQSHKEDGDLKWQSKRVTPARWGKGGGGGLQAFPHSPQVFV